MRRYAGLLLVVTLAALGSAWAGQGVSLSTADGLSMGVSEQGRIVSLRIGGMTLPLKGEGGFSLADFKDQPEPVNLVPNPGFEEGVKGWTLDRTQTLDTAVAHSGQASVRLSIPGPEPGNSNVQVILPVRPATHYRVGMWVRRHGAIAGSGGGPGAYSSFLDDQGNHLGPYQQGGHMPLQDDVWTAVAWDVVTVPGTTRLLLRSDLFRTTGTTWVDDFFIYEVRDQVYRPVSGQITATRGALVFKGTLPDSGLALEATLRTERDCLRVDGVVSDTRGQDRAVGVRFGLPLDLQGWTWWNDAEERQIIKPGDVCSNTYDCESGVGRCSIYPWSAVDAPQGGLSLALPVSQGPRVFVLQHNQTTPELSLSFFFGLAPDLGKNPSRAPFSFVIYPHNPAWGMRSAMERYYKLFAESFVKRPTYEGYLNYGNMEVLRPDTHELLTAGTRIPDAGDFGEGYQFIWHMHGCYDYRQIATDNRAMPDDPTVFGWLDKLVAEEGSKPRYYTPTAETKRKLVFDSSGRIRYIFDTQYWRAHEGYNGTDQPGWGLNFRVFEDPELTPWCAGKTRQMLDKYAADNPNHRPFSATLTADAIEGYSSNEVGLDYRREHFRTTLLPLTFGAESLAPALSNTIWDFHKKCWGPLTQQYQVITYGNGNVPSCIFTMPFVDLAMVEGRWPASRRGAEERFWRATAYHKLWRYWCDDTSWYRRPGDRASVLRHFRNGLAGAIFPALQALQASTSDIEPYRVYYRQYVVAIEELSGAGWEPVPYAQASEGVVVERFGAYGTGSLHLTLRNYAQTPAAATLTLDRQGLGIPQGAPLVWCDLLPGTPSFLPVPVGDWRVPVEADGSRALWIGTREQAAARGLRLAAALLDKTERLFEKELDATTRASLTGARETARRAAAGKPAAMLQAAEALQQFAEQFPKDLRTNSPVDLAKLLLRLRVAAAQTPMALLSLESKAPRVIEDGPRGAAVAVSWQIAGALATGVKSGVGEVRSPWPELAQAAAFKTTPQAGGLEATVNLPVPQQPERTLLPYVLLLHGQAGGQSYTLATPVDVLAASAIEVTVQPAKVVRGTPTAVTLTLKNRLHEPASVQLQFAVPARLGKVTPGEMPVALPAGGQAEAKVTVEIAPGAMLGSNFLSYEIKSAAAKFGGKGTVAVEVVAE